MTTPEPALNAESVVGLIPNDFRYLPHPSQAKDQHPKSRCPLCHATNDRAIHALAWNRKRGFWWPEEDDRG